MSFFPAIAQCGQQMEDKPLRRWMEVEDGVPVVKSANRWPVFKRGQRCEALHQALIAAWKGQPLTIDERNGLAWLKSQAEVWQHSPLAKTIEKVLLVADQQLITWKKSDPLVKKHYEKREAQFKTLREKVDAIANLVEEKTIETKEELLEKWRAAKEAGDIEAAHGVEKTLRFHFTALADAIEMSAQLTEEDEGPLLTYITKILTLGFDWVYQKEMRKIPDFILFRVLKSDQLGTDEASVWHKLRYLYPRVNTWPKDTILKLCRFEHMEQDTWPEFPKTRHFKKWLTEKGRKQVLEAMTEDEIKGDPRGILSARYINNQWEVHVRDVLGCITTLEADGSKINPHFLLYMPDESFALSLWKDEEEKIQRLHVAIEPLERWGRGFVEVSGDGCYPMTDGELWICSPPWLTFEKRRWPKIFETIGNQVKEIEEKEAPKYEFYRWVEKGEFHQRFRLRGGQARSVTIAAWREEALIWSVDRYWLPKFKEQLVRANRLMGSITA